MEVVLSSYLSAHLPLPCQTLRSNLNSVPSSTTTTKDQPSSEPQSEKTVHNPAMRSPKVSTTSVASGNEDENVAEGAASLSQYVTPAGQSRDGARSEKSVAETVTGTNELHFQLSSTLVLEESRTISSESSATCTAAPRVWHFSAFHSFMNMRVMSQTQLLWTQSCRLRLCYLKYWMMKKTN